VVDVSQEGSPQILSPVVAVPRSIQRLAYGLGDKHAVKKLHASSNKIKMSSELKRYCATVGPRFN
jgi:hypothetical protein